MSTNESQPRKTHTHPKPTGSRAWWEQIGVTDPFPVGSGIDVAALADKLADAYEVPSNIILGDS